MKKLFFAIAICIASVATYAQGAFELTFTVGYTSHHALLVLNEYGNGYMRVKYYDASCGCNNMVDQTMSTQTNYAGTYIVGSNPRYAGTNQWTSGYAPDNFFWTTNMYGGTQVYVTDYYGNLAGVQSREVSDRDLGRLKWEFGF